MYMNAIISLVYGLCMLVFVPLVADRYSSYKLKQYENLDSYELNANLWRIFNLAISCGYLFYVLNNKNLTEVIFCGIFIFLALVMIEVDHKIRLIGNEMLLLTFALGCIYRLAIGGFYGLGLGLLTALGVGAFLIFSFWFAKAFMIACVPAGAGDFKAMMVVGLILGYPQIQFALLCTALIMLAYIFVGLVRKKLALTSYIPMAGFIMAGLIFGLMGFTF